MRVKVRRVRDPQRVSVLGSGAPGRMRRPAFIHDFAAVHQYHRATATGAVEPTGRQEVTASRWVRWAQSFLESACVSANHAVLPGHHPTSSARRLVSYERLLCAGPAPYPPVQGSPTHHRPVVPARATRAKYTTRMADFPVSRLPGECPIHPELGPGALPMRDSRRPDAPLPPCVPAFALGPWRLSRKSRHDEASPAPHDLMANSPRLNPAVTDPLLP